VLVDRYFEGVPFVGGDDERIGVIATRHLMQQGYRRIAHLRGPNISTAIGRYDGYIRALREAKIRIRQDYIVSAEYHNEEGGYEGTKKLLSLRPRPDAIFAASDPIAIGAMQALQEAGLQLPTDFGVIGVGMHRYGEYLRIPLSTVDQHRTEIGRLAASILLGAIEGKPVPTSPVLIEPALIVRDSSRRIPELDNARHRPLAKEAVPNPVE
jgi:LacI family transcriptional regulator